MVVKAFGVHLKFKGCSALKTFGTWYGLGFTAL